MTTTSCRSAVTSAELFIRQGADWTTIGSQTSVEQGNGCHTVLRVKLPQLDESVPVDIRVELSDGDRRRVTHDWMAIPTDPDACVAAPEVPNGIDDDCDGEIDEGSCAVGEIHIDTCGCVASTPINCHINVGAKPDVVHASRHTGKPYTFEACLSEADEYFDNSGVFACGKSIPAGPIVYQEVVWGKCRFFTNSCP